tara:strand:+ start:92 stop:406 length:315 start_codon:yes stop_codon:yes gene_type:complete
MKKIFYVFIIVLGCLSFTSCGGGSVSSDGKTINYSFSDANSVVKNAGFVIMDSKKVDNGFSYVSYLFYVRVGGSFCVQEFRSNSNNAEMYSQDCGISESFWNSL